MSFEVHAVCVLSEDFTTSSHSAFNYNRNMFDQQLGENSSTLSVKRRLANLVDEKSSDSYLFLFHSEHAKKNKVIYPCSS